MGFNSGFKGLISAPDDVSGEHPVPHILSPEKERPLPNEFGGWVGTRAGLDALGERKNIFPHARIGTRSCGSRPSRQGVRK